MINGKYYTVKEAAKLLKIPFPTLMHRIYSGHLTATRHGKGWLVEAGVLSKYKSAARPHAGRPKKISKCSCGFTGGVRQMLLHKRECRKERKKESR